MGYFYKFLFKTECAKDKNDKFRLMSRLFQSWRPVYFFDTFVPYHIYRRVFISVLKT